MKQTVEEAAREYIYKARASFVGITPEEYEEQINPEYPYNVGTDEDFESLFIAGADWQSKQSPWISVKKQLPEEGEPVLIRLKDGIVRLVCYDTDDDVNVYFWSDNYAYETISGWDVTHWFPIPSFDEILEANKDVLERIKEKGD